MFGKSILYRTVIHIQFHSDVCLWNKGAWGEERGEKSVTILGNILRGPLTHRGKDNAIYMLLDYRDHEDLYIYRLPEMILAICKLKINPKFF